jgi:phage baseplate assembly protein W
MSEASFLGIGWSFPPRFTATGLQTVAAEEDIRESLLILLTTNPGERIMQPNFGCDLKAHVFDLFEESTYAVLRDRIEQAILFFEPRIELENIEFVDRETINGCLQIEVYYRVRATNNRYNLVFPFYFNEATNARL